MRILVGGNDHLDRAGSAGTEAVGDHVVALAGLFVLGKHGDAGHARLQAEQRERQSEQHDDGADSDEELASLDAVGELGEEFAVVVTLRVPRQGELVDAGAEQRGEQRECGEQDEADRQHHAGGHRAERRDRNEEHGGQADQHGDAGEEHGLAGGVHRNAGGVLRILGVRMQRRSVSGDDEERVVDAEREREHHGEVQRPDRQVRDLGDAVQDAHRGEQAGSGEHERETRGGERAERDHEDHCGDGPREDLGLEHAFAVDLVEVVPEGGRAGEGDRDLVTGHLGREIRDLVAELACGSDGFGRVDLGTGLDHHRHAVHARLRRHRLAEPGFGDDQRVDIGDHLLERRIVDRCGGTLDHDDRRLRRQTTELLVDHVSGGERFASVDLPHRAREGMLQTRGEHAQADCEDRPGDDHQLAVAMRPATHPGQRRMHGVGLHVVVRMQRLMLM